MLGETAAMVITNDPLFISTKQAFEAWQNNKGGDDQFRKIPLSKLVNAVAKCVESGFV